MQTSTNESGRRLNERRSIWRSAAPRVCFAFDHARESLPLFFSSFCRIARSCRAQSLDWTPCDFRNPLLWFEEVRRRYWRRILKFPAETGSVCARAGLQTTSIWRSHESLYWPFDLCAWSTRPAPRPPPTHPATYPTLTQTFSIAHKLSGTSGPPPWFDRKGKTHFNSSAQHEN